MKLKEALLLVGMLVSVAVAMAAFMHPQGFDGVIAMVVGGESAAEPEDETVDTGSAVRSPKAAADAELRKGDRAYDSGRFNSAVTFYMIAYGAAQTPRQKQRAKRGLHQAVLANALVRGASVPSGSVGAADRFRELRTKAESSRTETDWLAAARFAAGAQLTGDVRDTVRSALDAARSGGVVETQLLSSLPHMGAKSRPLRAAMTAVGLGSAFTRPGSTASLPGGNGSGGTRRGLSDLDGPSGIGGVGAASMPHGDFSREMTGRLKQAIQWATEGLELYRQAGDTEALNRNELRTKAHKLLKQARDVFNDAQEQDPESGDLDRWMHRVMEGIAQLNKERVFGD